MADLNEQGVECCEECGIELNATGIDVCNECRTIRAAIDAEERVVSGLGEQENGG